MALPKLKTVTRTQGNNQALKDGTVRPKACELEFIEVDPIIAAFRRMVRNLEFDICEMAPTTYMIARALGAPYIALPIFVMRRFHHGGFVVRPDAGIRTPKDLEGKKVGVRAYSVTTGVWTRGILTNEYGMDSSKVTWVVDDEEHVTSLKLPPNVIHAPAGKSLQSMMAAGEIQAGFTGPAGVGRAGPPIGNWDMNAPTGGDNDTTTLQVETATGVKGSVLVTGQEIAPDIVVIPPKVNFGAVALTGINELTRWAAAVMPALKNVQPLSLIGTACMALVTAPDVPANTPKTPASWQLGTRPAGGGSG